MSNKSFSFVRKEMVEERAAPVSSQGLLYWMHQNLLSSIPQCSVDPCWPIYHPT